MFLICSLIYNNTRMSEVLDEVLKKWMVTAREDVEQDANIAGRGRTGHAQEHRTEHMTEHRANILCSNT